MLLSLTLVDALVILTVAAFLFLGHELSVRVWNGETVPSMPLERICSAGVLALCVWIGSLWILGLTLLLTRELLLGRTIAAGLLATVLFFARIRRGPRVRPTVDRAALLPIALAGVPILLWTIFAMWRGAVLPPLSYDALSYHIPKAVLFARAHGFVFLDQLNSNVRSLPPNYELMLADVILTTGSDRVTEWLSTLHYLLFIVAGTALVQRWWGVHPKRDAIVALLIAQVPVALLQSSAHKNDLLLAFLVVSALLWGTRFAVNGETPAAMMMILAMAMAVGTKPQAAFVAVALGPFVLWRLWRGREGRRLLYLAAASAVALTLLGGVSYVIDHKDALAAAEGHEHTEGQERTDEMAAFPFRDFANIWQAPYVLIAAPFSSNAFSLAVPWEKNPWFWRRYELYFSDLGIGFSLALLALPFAFVVLRPRPAEGVIGGVVTLAAFVAMSPLAWVPHGFYLISLARYALFIVPVVLGWSVEAVMRNRGVAWLVLLASALSFVAYGIDCTVNDSYAPLRFAIWASEHPGTRIVPFSPNRAACMADRMAAPHDKIAIDAGFGSWISPVFGRDLTRPVQLLSGRGPLQVDPDVRWVVIDRSFETVWNRPGYTDLSQAFRILPRGSLSPEGQKFMHQVLTLPGFGPVMLNIPGGQAIMKRREVTSAP